MINDGDIYAGVARIPTGLLLTWVQESFPSVTKDDIDRGYMIRYFARQANHNQGDVLEISKDTFDRIQTANIYKTVSMQWRIAGPLDDVPGPQHINSPTRLYTGVMTANRLAMEEADKAMPGLKFRILNFAQFWQG
jgi:hypothetical protein